MKNSEQPINPVPEKSNCYGLTKREYFAGLAMQGLLANNSIIDNHSSNEMEWISKHATCQADELLKQLEK